MRRTWTLTLGQRSAVTTKQHRLSENARPYAGTEVAGRPDLPATSPDAQGTIPERSPTGDCSFSIKAAVWSAGWTLPLQMLRCLRYWDELASARVGGAPFGPVLLVSKGECRRSSTGWSGVVARRPNLS
jgi:hypothetical protein